MNKYFIVIILFFFTNCITGQPSKHDNNVFFRFSNFKPDFGFSANKSLDIPNQLNIIDVDPTNSPGHAFEIGYKRKIKPKTFVATSFGVFRAEQIKSFLNYRFDEDYQEFGLTSFYLTSASYKHQGIFLNTTLEQYIFHGLFIEAGLKVSAALPSSKQNVPSFNTPLMRETYASTFYDIQKEVTPLVLFYNVRFGYNFKGFAASFLYEQNLTKLERKFTLRGVEYIESQAFWKNIGFSLSYTFRPSFFGKDKENFK